MVPFVAEELVKDIETATTNIVPDMGIAAEGLQDTHVVLQEVAEAIPKKAPI